MFFSQGQHFFEMVIRSGFKIFHCKVTLDWCFNSYIIIHISYMIYLLFSYKLDLIFFKIRWLVIDRLILNKIIGAEQLFLYSNNQA